MMTIVGAYRTASDPPVSRLALDFSRIDMVANWRKCHSMATFLAEFISEDMREPTNASPILSGVMNELVENAVKFSMPGPTWVRMRFPFWGDRLTVETKHRCTHEQAERCRAWVARLGGSDPEILFVEQLEHSAVHDPENSRLGLITLCKDHGAEVGLRVTIDDTDALVDLQVHLPLTDLY